MDKARMVGRARAELEKVFGPELAKLTGQERQRSPPVTALAGVNLTVAAGELVAVLGPSGSGKSTLLHLAGTLDRPSSGTVRVTGLDVAALGDRELAGLRATRIGVRVPAVLPGRAPKRPGQRRRRPAVCRGRAG